MLNKGPRVPLLTLGVGKTAAAHLIEHLAMALPFTGFKYVTFLDFDFTPWGYFADRVDSTTLINGNMMDLLCIVD